MFGPSFSKDTLKANLNAAGHRATILANKRKNELVVLERECGEQLASKCFDRARMRATDLIMKRRRGEAEELASLMCELVRSRVEQITRLPTCSEDALESVHTIIYAAPRLDGEPELLEVRKQLILKFGDKACAPARDAAPGSHVSDAMIKALSLKLPTQEECIAVMREIAEKKAIAVSEEDWRKSSIGLVKPGGGEGGGGGAGGSGLGGGGGQQVTITGDNGQKTVILLPAPQQQQPPPQQWAPMGAPMPPQMQQQQQQQFPPQQQPYVQPYPQQPYAQPLPYEQPLQLQQQPPYPLQPQYPPPQQLQPLQYPPPQPQAPFSSMQPVPFYPPPSSARGPEPPFPTKTLHTDEAETGGGAAGGAAPLLPPPPSAATPASEGGDVVAALAARLAALRK